MDNSFCTHIKSDGERCYNFHSTYLGSDPKYCDDHQTNLPYSSIINANIKNEQDNFSLDNNYEEDYFSKNNYEQNFSTTNDYSFWDELEEAKRLSMMEQNVQNRLIIEEQDEEYYKALKEDKTRNNKILEEKKEEEPEEFLPPISKTKNYNLSNESNESNEQWSLPNVLCTSGGEHLQYSLPEHRFTPTDKNEINLLIRFSTGARMRVKYHPFEPLKTLVNEIRYYMKYNGILSLVISPDVPLMGHPENTLEFCGLTDRDTIIVDK